MVNFDETKMHQLHRFVASRCVLHRTAAYKEAGTFSDLHWRGRGSNNVSSYLAELNRRTFDSLGRLLLSAVIVEAKSGRPADEFYNFAQSVGLDPGMLPSEHEAFWRDQVQ
jgi:hypothetical protein